MIVARVDSRHTKPCSMDGVSPVSGAGWEMPNSDGIEGWYPGIRNSAQQGRGLAAFMEVSRWRLSHGEPPGFAPAPQVAATAFVVIQRETNERVDFA